MKKGKVDDKKNNKLDLTLILLWPIISGLLSFILNANALLSVILFYGLPSIFLSFRYKQYIIKSLIFSFFVSVPMIIILDYIGNVTKTWIFFESVIPILLFGKVTVEVVLWSFLLFYFTLMFYEAFIDKHVDKRLFGRKLKYLVILCLVCFVAFVACFLWYPKAFNVPYFYLAWASVAVLIPVLLQLFKFPSVFAKFFKAAAYFFYLNIIYEITALVLGWWAFPAEGEFIGWVSLFGLRFPFEEFFFWILLFTLAILSYYEFFDDDEK